MTLLHETRPPMIQHLDVALHLRDLGFGVLPNCKDKYPSFETARDGTALAMRWEAYKQHIADESTVRRWFHNGALIGVPCGAVSGNLECIDFDNKGNPGADELYQAWHALVEADAPGLVDRLYLEQTQSGGYHHLYRCTESVGGNQKLAQRAATDAEKQRDPKLKAVTLIETRGEKGQVVVAPSAGYTLIRGSFDTMPVITPEERAILLHAAQALNRYVEPRAVVNTTRALRTQRAADGLPTGEEIADLYNARYGDTALERLEHAGWTIERQYATYDLLRRPGKQRGASATLGYVAPGVLYVFSSSAAPFESEHGYSAFAQFALLDHDGDFAAATYAAAELLGVDYLSNVPDPSFDEAGHACCPHCGTRLRRAKNRNGWRCLKADGELCYWWQGEGYEPPNAAPRVDPATGEVIDDEDEQPRENQAQLLLRLAAPCELFHSPDGSAYVRVPVDAHIETWPIRGGGLSDWLTHHFFEQYGKPPSTNARTNALEVLAARARYRGDERGVFTRLAHHDGALYLDLCNPAWEAIQITAEGWQVVSNPPVAFRRAKGMRPLPYPVKGGTLEPLRDLLNVSDDTDWRLLVGWLVGTLLPPGAADCAHLLLTGEQGSAKSTATRMLRSIIDPNAADTRPAPREERDLAIAARNGRVLSFDNLSYLPNWLSDALCRLSTGAAFATRELYSDDGEALFSAKRPAIFNGIGTLADRADLVDRTIMVNLQPIAANARRPASAVWPAFDSAHPRLLGALCDAASTALRNLPDTRIATLPRLADFALWVEAAAPALGWPAGAFVTTLHTMREASSATILEADPLAADLMRVADAHANGWRGSPTALLSELKAAYDNQRLPKGFPATAATLGKRLKRLAPELRRAGYLVEQKDGKERLITLARAEAHDGTDDGMTATTFLPSPILPRPNAPDDGNDGNDGRLQADLIDDDLFVDDEGDEDNENKDWI